MPLLIAAGVVALAVAIAELPRIKDFHDSAPRTRRGHRLEAALRRAGARGVRCLAQRRVPVREQRPAACSSGGSSPPSGWSRLVFATAWWFARRRRRSPGRRRGRRAHLPATVCRAGLYVEAKALAVPASLIMAFILGALLLKPEDVDETAIEPAVPDPDAADDPDAARRARRAAEPSGRPRLRTVIAVPFIALAAYSSFLALRDAVVAPDDRFSELGAPRRGRGLVGARPDQRPLHRLLPARRRGAEPREERRAADPGAAREGVPPAGGLRLRIRERPRRLRLRGHHRRRLPERRAARTSRRSSAPTPTCSGSGTASTPFSGCSPRRPGRAGSCAATTRSSSAS